jgi:putative ABC transport system permease protein
MVSRLLIRLALLAQPPETRHEFGPSMERLALDDIGAAKRRGDSGLHASISAFVDIVASGLRARFRPSMHSLSSTRIQPMDQLRSDLRFAVRSLLRRPGFTSTAVLTLALGIGSTAAIFSVVNGVLLRGLPYPESERLVRLWSTDRRAPGPLPDGSVSVVVFDDWKSRARSFESMAIWTRSRPTLTGLGEPELIAAGSVSEEFFRVFGAEPMLGRAFTSEERLPSGPLAVVVSEGFWRERLGARRDVLGETIELNGRSHQIVGIAPAGFDYPERARLWLANRNDPESCGRGCVYVNAVARLVPGVSLGAARAEMSGIADRLSVEFPDYLTNATVGMASLQETTVGDVRPALLILLGAVGMVLLIACANVANLLIARGASRADEMAVRVALGAGRRRILSQLITESVVLAVAAGVLGIGLAAAAARALPVVAPEGIPRLDEVGIDATVVLFTVGLVVLTTLLFGLAPAARLAATPVARTLRQDSTRMVGRRGIGRSTLLAVEVGLSLMLLVGAGLLLRSFASLQRLDPGFRVADVAQFTVSLPSARYDGPADAVQFADEMERRLEALPGIEGVTSAMGVPLSQVSIWSSFQRSDRPEPAPGEGTSAALRPVDDDFFADMEIAVQRGRGFEASDRYGAVPVAVVNRRFADRFYPGEDPVGKRISIGVSVGYRTDADLTIVGVVEDVRWEQLTGDFEPEIYIPTAQAGSSFMTVLMRSADPGAAVRAARQEVLAMDAALPFRDPGTMQDLLDTHTIRPRFYLMLLAIFAGLAVALAAVGLYGVVAYLVAERRREIGVRMALGARAGQVVGLVMRQGLVPAGAGAAVGLAAALATGRVIQGLLFGITPTDTVTLIATTAVLLTVVVLACLLPARRATRIAPASALRAER